MADFAIKNPTEFNADLRKLETTDRNHADVFNKEFEQLINNDAFLKAVADLAVEHMKDNAVHVTTQDKQIWSGKAGTAVATQNTDGLESAADKRKLDGIAEGAEVNQFAFSRIDVGGAKVTSNGKTAAFILEAGSNITITADNASKKIVITANKDGGNADTVDGYHAAHFAAADHGHDGRYYTKTESNNLLNQKANSSHSHNGVYYTKDEINGALNGKANTDHNHDARYYMIDQADNSRISMGPGINKAMIGSSSVVIGSYALPNTEMANSTGTRCTVVIGNNACESTKIPANAPETEFVENVIIGNRAALSLHEMSEAGIPCGYNTILGSLSAINMERGTMNTFLGYYTGAKVNDFKKRNFSFCTFVGSLACVDESISDERISFATAIGSYATITGSRQIQLGDSGTSVYAWSALNNRSDARDKADIRDAELGLEFLLKHRPVEFRWDRRDDYFEEKEVEVEKTQTIKDEKTGEIREETYTEVEIRRVPIPKDGSKKCKRFHEGFIAQEVKAIMDEMGIDFAGYQDHSVNGGADVLTIGYTEYIPIIVKAIQQIKQMYDAEIESLKKEISTLKNKKVVL